jgi:phospholipase C
MAFSVLFGTGCSKDTTATNNNNNPTGINKVGHIIVIYQENHSFDNLYGEYTGTTHGLSEATAAQYTQVDTGANAGKPYTTLPWNDTHFNPGSLPNKYFNIDTYDPPDSLTEDLVHRYYQEQYQIDGGKMDKFAAWSTARGLSMGYYHTATLPMTPLVQQYTLCDNFFHSAFGGSFLNHIFLIAAAAPVFTTAPSTIVATLNADGTLKTDGQVTPDGYVVNTSFSVNSPHPSSTAAANLVPNQTMPTIGDRLNDKGVNWAWYSGGFNNALAGTPGANYQFHHQPFIYFKNYADGTALKAAHLKDETDFDAALAAGTLPPVSFVKFYGDDNEHPNYSKLIDAENYLVAKINKIKASSVWSDCVIIVTYDEHGGFWDHVDPKSQITYGDKWGPGCRVPGIIISPFSVKGVDHTPYETVSILAFIEKRFGLPALGTRDAAANPFTNALNFN